MNLNQVTSQLEKAINTKLMASNISEPPRLVRANSAFEKNEKTNTTLG